MSKRYPPIYSIVAIIALVTVVATKTKGAALYVASTIVKTLATLTSNIANYLGFVLTDGFAIVVSFADTYAVFCLHVIIVSIYCKMLFSKRAKEIHTPHGFGYAVCENCYNIERAIENKWRNK